MRILSSGLSQTIQSSFDVHNANSRAIEEFIVGEELFAAAEPSDVIQFVIYLFQMFSCLVEGFFKGELLLDELETLNTYGRKNRGKGARK